MADMKSIKFPGSDTVYTPVDQVARDEAAKKLNSDQLPTAINEALAQAKESGDFKGDPGDPGKTAYQYAQDGGYTGSEEDFAKKLAADTSGLPATSDADNGKVLTVVNGNWEAASLPVYDGEYVITPTVEDQELLTAQQYLDANLKIEKIPYAEVTNAANGVTATIG